MDLDLVIDWAPTQEQRDTVRLLAACGVERKQIAQLIDVSLERLNAYFPRELELGLIEANAAVANALYSAALGGNLEAMKFWLTTRGKWAGAPTQVKIDGEVRHRDIPAHITPQEAREHYLEFMRRTEDVQ